MMDAILSNEERCWESEELLLRKGGELVKRELNETRNDVTRDIISRFCCYLASIISDLSISCTLKAVPPDLPR